MATKIEVKGLIEALSRKTTIYTPIIEGIVNAIHAIEDTKRKDGNIIVTFMGEDNLIESEEDGLPRIRSIKIEDNGIGFSEKNKDSFETIYSRLKKDRGGKGFGRITFLKYFENIKINSVFFDEDSSLYKKREFSFVPEKEIIKGDKISDSLNKNTSTSVFLDHIKDEYMTNLDKGINTIARHLLEHLLIYFIDSQYTVPKITLIDERVGGEEPIVLNDFFGNSGQITEIYSEIFDLQNGEKEEKFIVKVFKVFYTNSNSSITLCAHNRTVTREPLYNYIPEFKEDFVDEKFGNYVIKAYVIGEYLDSNVNNERNKFIFPKSSSEKKDYFLFSQDEIEYKVSNIIKDIFGEEVTTRKSAKKEKIINYINTKAPHHKNQINDIDFDKIMYGLTDQEIEISIQRILTDKEIYLRYEVSNILEEKYNLDEKEEKINEILNRVDNIAKDRLAHYVCLRKVVLDLFKKSLEWNEDKEIENEDTIHNIVYPRYTTSNDISYDHQNLWLIDERLNFSELVISENIIEGGRTDISIFHNRILLREGQEYHNPITILEFKKPERNEYSRDKDPITQMLDYVETIRSDAKKSIIKGTTIHANDNTPAYVYLICSITPKIKKFAKLHDLNMSPDNKGYFGYSKNYKTYIEIISFEKVVKDSEQRNKAFFKKLGID